jgi:RNA polymerase sigma-70 factor (ECF subfamily)
MIVIVLPDFAAEDALLARAVTGDQDAFRQIYDAYFAPVYQFIRLHVRNRDSAHDLAADVFIDFYLALQAAPRIPACAPGCFAWPVTRSTTITAGGSPSRPRRWRSGSRRARPARESQFMAAARIEQVRLALQRLPPDQQEVLLLRFGQGLNLEQTADLMDRSISAIKSLQFRALDALRAELARRESVSTWPQANSSMRYNNCVDRMAAGDSLESCLRAYPAYAERLRPLLQAGAAVRVLRPTPAELRQEQASVWRGSAPRCRLLARGPGPGSGGCC